MTRSLLATLLLRMLGIPAVAPDKRAAGTFVGEVGTRSLRQTSLVVSPITGGMTTRW